MCLNTANSDVAEDSSAVAESSMPAPLWAWLNDSDQWIKYSAEHSSQITAALKAGEEDVVVEVAPRIKMRVRFAVMTQCNVSTGYQREVRCGDATSTGVWERQQEDGSWTPFNETMSRLLTAARVCGLDEITATEASDKILVNMVDLVTDGKERVRCVPTVTTSPAGNNIHCHCNDIHSYIVWQWKDKAGAWHRYPPAVIKKLEGVYCEGGRMVTVTGRGFETKVDLWDTVQVKRVIDEKKKGEVIARS